jgi:VanZ family protein
MRLRTDLTELRITRGLRIFCGIGAIAVIGQLLFLAEPAYAQRLVEATWDKGVHVFVFGGLAFLVWVALGGRWPLFVWVFILLVGAIDETRQIYTPGRTADFNDFLADGFGAAAAMIMAQVITLAPDNSIQGA